MSLPVFTTSMHDAGGIYLRVKVAVVTARVSARVTESLSGPRIVALKFAINPPSLSVSPAILPAKRMLPALMGFDPP